MGGDFLWVYGVDCGGGVGVAYSVGTAEDLGEHLGEDLGEHLDKCCGVGVWRWGRWSG